MSKEVPTFLMDPHKITVDRDKRQRRSLPDIQSLADSILRGRQIHPITIDKEDGLVAGECRLEACKLLKIEVRCQRFDDLSEAEKQQVELEENVRRVALHWKDECEAVLKYTELRRKYADKHGLEAIARALGYSAQHYYRLVKVARALRSAHPRVTAADTLSQALAVLERETERVLENETNQLAELIRTGGPITIPGLNIDVEAGTATATEVPALAQAQAIAVAQAQSKEVLCGNFIEWVPAYSGPRFSFAHLDLPYGINHHQSDQGKTDTWGGYEDTPEVYFALLRSFLTHRDKILLPLSAGMHWFSMKFYSQTLSLFAELAPEITVNPVPLTWTKTDNRGIIPDIERGPRQITEFCLFWRRNDRKVIKGGIGNGYPAPSGDKEHQSSKPVPMLKHFFQMFVDENSLVLDPTCGSGTALVAAQEMGAKLVLGLELNPENASIAQNAVTRSRNLLTLNRKVS